MKKYDDGIVYLKEYGKINLKLKEYMDERKITRNALAKRVNTRFEVIDKWYNNRIENIDLDILARICFVLSCDINDILKYEKPDE
jgi:DNA-binding Xre family transcriptional regulator